MATKIIFAKNRKGNTPLHLASALGNEQIVELFLKFANDKNVDPVILFAKNRFGYTSLHLAAALAHKKVVDFLSNFATEKAINSTIEFLASSAVLSISTKRQERATK